ncbi:choline transporter, putative [Rhizoctonia solani AG-3 Rhs1AP]|uniref:Choline transporter, putative n=2 Tax=Rhizoctonia solani AG-3 TaxID=1086053 RepID=X8JSV3_9AGAM|nr:choline transporter, putative [Rhizoctonia solani AG-3 Rhs1AP]KEP53988.1 putative choline transporter [Rhizoctonia solani 123E]
MPRLGSLIRIAEPGYQPRLRRNSSVWLNFGVGFSVTNSWWGISAGLVVGVNSGGPSILLYTPVLYDIILIAIISACAGVSLAEFASAVPNSGEQYCQTGQLELASRKVCARSSILDGCRGIAGSCLSLGNSLVLICLSAGTTGAIRTDLLPTGSSDRGSSLWPFNLSTCSLLS